MEHRLPPHDPWEGAVTNGVVQAQNASVPRLQAFLTGDRVVVDLLGVPVLRLSVDEALVFAKDLALAAGRHKSVAEEPCPCGSDRSYRLCCRDAGL